LDSPIPTNLDGLIGLSRRHGVDIKPTLLRVLTDLYVQKQAHSADEERQYTALALRLLDVVDAATRATVARTLAAYPGAPVAVLRHLVGDTGQTAPAAPARTAVEAQQETSTRPQEGSAAGTSGPSHLATLFFAADANERRMILANLRYADTSKFQRKLPGDPRTAIGQMERAALAGRPAEVVRELERALGVSCVMAERIVDDASGEPIVVAAKALDMPLPVLQRILLFVNPAIGHSVQRVYDLSALFEELSADSARCLVSLWRDPDQARGALRPPAFDGEAGRTRRETTRLPERLATLDEDDDIFLDRVQRTS
jgi:hypothetical protein